MVINLQPLTSAHQSFLWEMLYEVIYVPEGQPLPEPDIVYLPELACYVEDWGQASDAGFVALDAAGSQPLGAVWLRLFNGSHKGYGFVAEGIPEVSLAVKPAYRGQGIGTKLLQHLLASECGRSPISLSVSIGNPAIRLYERCGFKIVATGEDSYTMLRV